VSGRLATRRSSRRFDLVCSAVPFGYGPVSKLLAIVQHTRAAGASAAFVGTGIAYELACRSNLFDDLIMGRPDVRATKSMLKAADHVLCVMDPEFTKAALELAQPISVVDSLFWMWDRIPRPFLDAKHYWVQDFFGVRQRAAKLSQRPEVVGPILPRSASGVSSSDGGLLVNLGGCESPYGDSYESSPYVDFVVESLAGSKLAEVYRQQILLIAGQGCVASVADRLGVLGIRAESLSLEEAESAFHRADLILTSPGLTGTLQAFRSGTPTVFLPPQNYSQWLILSLLREHGLAPSSFHWRDVLPDDPAPARMPESVAVPQVTAAIRHLSTGGLVTTDRLASNLSSMLELDLDELRLRQQRALASWNANDGARAIAGLTMGDPS
jgi:hypothetical protein